MHMSIDNPQHCNVREVAVPLGAYWPVITQIRDNVRKHACCQEGHRWLEKTEVISLSEKLVYSDQRQHTTW